jgi:alkaline phosphatase D
MDRLEADRRTFMTALIAGITGVGLAGCSDDTKNGASTGSSTTAVSLPVPKLDHSPFTLGIASGDPAPDSVILWTRLALDPLAPDGAGAMPSSDVPVEWEVASDEKFASIVTKGTAVASAKLAHSVHVDATGLEAGQWFWYRFRVGEHTSAVGRTRTMPADTDSPDTLRLAIASCQDYTAGYYTPYAAMVGDELDLVLFLGDYIYEYANHANAVRPVGDKECTDLATYRLRYSTYKTDKDLQAAHTRCPWMVIWDDHEVENNYADMVDDEKTPADAFATRRAAAYQAYYEHQPLRLDPPNGKDYRIYRAAKFGTLADLFLLDGRQYRGDQPCNTKQDAIVDKASCPDLGAERTMLGTEQERWLLDGLGSSAATWKVITQQTVMFPLELGKLVLNVDQWDGYPTARKRILDFIDSENVDDVVVLTGDIHSAGAAELSVAAADGSRKPVAVEFIGTSITSGSLVDSVPGGAAIAKVENFPGSAYLNVKDHGYARCTVTAAEWRTVFVVCDISTPTAPARVDATCVTKKGTPAVTQV